jgi:hypothetical protein
VARVAHAIYNVTSKVNEQQFWSLHNHAAQLRCGSFFGCIDAARPDTGLHGIALESSLTIDVLRVYRADGAGDRSWPLPIAESYVRGSDLVACYQPVPDWPFSPQLYWRANSLYAVRGVLSSVSLLVSVQTHLLDTVPQIGVASTLPCDEFLLVTSDAKARPRAERMDPSQSLHSPSGDCCVVARFREQPLSYVEIMPAGDFQAVGLSSGANGSTLEWRLFAEFLEKGVIRRARLHAAVVPRENDIELTAACCTAIDKLELPLTT